MDTQGLIVVAIAVVSGYLIGAIPWGVVVARVVGGPDPRTIGSGRTGGANVMRAIGPRAAAITGILDVLKGVAAVLIAILLGGDGVAQVLAALAAILGHSRSPFINFGGGRGVAPGFGGLIMIQPIGVLIVVPVFIVVLVVSRYSSLASLTASAAAGVAIFAIVLVSDQAAIYLAYAVAATGMIWLFHIDNIRRLLAGQERKVSLRR